MWEKEYTLDDCPSYYLVEYLMNLILHLLFSSDDPFLAFLLEFPTNVSKKAFKIISRVRWKGEVVVKVDETEDGNQTIDPRSSRMRREG